MLEESRTSVFLTSLHQKTAALKILLGCLLYQQDLVFRNCVRGKWFMLGYSKVHRFCISETYHVLLKHSGGICERILKLNYSSGTSSLCNPDPISHHLA